MILIAFTIGVISGTLGIGGGVIFNPLLVSLGVPPAVASSTGMYLVMFSTLTNSILYSISGYLNWSFAIWLALFTVTGSILGLKIVKKLIEKTGRVSILVLLLGAVIMLPAIVIPVNATFTVVDNLKQGVNVLAFKGLCH